MKSTVDRHILTKNSKKFFIWRGILISSLLVFLFPVISYGDVSASTDMQISAIVASTPQNGGGNNNNTPGGGGSTTSTAGGGGAIGSYVIPTDITFSGVAYPNANVYLLLDGVEISSTVADSNSFFSVKIPSLTPGVKVFSLVAQDADGVRSILVTLPITIQDKTSTIISNIFIPPTISIDKNAYAPGDHIVVHGYSDLSSAISIIIDSQTVININADSSGYYNFVLKTDGLSLGEHTIQIKAEDNSNNNEKASVLGKVISFLVSNDQTMNNQNNLNTTLVTNINAGKKISITDFSILAFWYEKPNPPKNLDLNGDGIIDIKDFSILAYYWNG